MKRLKKTFESDQVVVFDQFLNDDDFETFYHYLTQVDYSHVNMGGVVSRAWKPRDRFPFKGGAMRKYASEEEIPEDESRAYPSHTIFDRFAEELHRLSEEYPHYTGVGGTDWRAFSVAPWIYQQGTGLSLHTDGSNVYSGAYTFFATKKWDVHWGGLLLVMDEKTDEALQALKNEVGTRAYWGNNFDFERMNQAIFESGFAQCILPKPNRIVLIKNTVNHMITAINEHAGDQVRMSVAGFFQKYPKQA